MDLVEALRKKTETLPNGEHLRGLRAVLSHVEVAFRHLGRGQDSSENSAFTDVIYRTNQAFEGAAKEAYRVLAGKDPAKKSPYQIERYLEENSVFRDRVLSQFKTYRTEWRNPSAHDYMLDFDEPEAFLAIISVSAFACLLSDQIAEELAFRTIAASPSTKSMKSSAAEFSDLYSQTVAVVRQFVSASPEDATMTFSTEAQLVGALHGAIAASLPDVHIFMEVIITPKGQRPNERFHRADLIVERGNEKLIIEAKRWPAYNGIEAAKNQIEAYLEMSGVADGIVVMVPEIPEEMAFSENVIEDKGRRIGVIFPLRQDTKNTAG